MMIHKRARISMIVHMAFMIAIGALYLSFVWTNSNSTTLNRALGLAMTAKAGYQPEMIAKLATSDSNAETDEFELIRYSLKQLVKINNEVSSAYFYTVHNDEIHFLASTESQDIRTGGQYSPKGHQYGDTRQKMLLTFKEGRQIVVIPQPGRKNPMVNILLPVTDPISDRILGVFGMDFSYDLWISHTRQSVIQAVLIILCILLLYIASHQIIKKNMVLKAERDKLSDMNRQLSEKEELFRTIYEQSPVGISFGNYNNNITDVNRMFEKITGRSKSELISLHWQDITYPEDIQMDMNLFKKFKAGEINSYTIQKRYIKPDRSLVWVNMKIAALELENKNLHSHICIAEDITERIQTEISLQESERSNAMLLSNLPGMAYRCNFDRDWTMQFVSEGCYALTGYRPESLINNKELTFNQLINEDYREYLWEKWNEILKQKTIFREEYRITTADNDVKWVYEQGQGVYDENGEVQAIEGLIIDISLQKKREEEILYLNYHDAMTGLYNRRYFEDVKKVMDEEKKYPLSILTGDINGLKLINSALGHAEGDKLVLVITQIMKECCRKGDILARTGGDEFSILMPYTTYEEADKIVNKVGRLCEEYKKKVPDEAYHISISVGCATKTDSDTPFGAVVKEAEDSMYRHKLLQSKSLHSSIISSMKCSLYEKSQETEEHARRLIFISKSIGATLNLVEEQLNELELLSTLHDIGKIGISDNILNKPGKLTEEEWLEMKKHPEMGYRIAMSTPELAPIADFILNHHERWDGTGYPCGRKGEEIPLLSRIIAIADSYDAMTSDRPYRKAMSKEAAMDEIRKNSGTQFDPELASIFLESIVHKL